MRPATRFATLVILVLSAPAWASSAAADEPPTVGLFDTVGPLPQPVPSQVLQGRQGWSQVPEDQLDHRFAGDVVLRNRRIAVVLRNGAPGAEVYSRSPDGWQRRGVLVPCGAAKARRLVSVKATANDAEAVAAEATFQAADGKPLGLVCQVALERPFVRTEPRAETSRLEIQSAGRFGVIPDFYADDIVIDAVHLPGATVHIPTENMFAEVLGGGPFAAILWDGPPQDAQLTLAGSGDGRQICSTQLAYAKQGKICFAVLDFCGACCAPMLAGLPDRKEPIGGFKLQSPVKRLGWQMPYPAQWRVDFVTDKDDPKLVRSREMSAPYPYPAKNGKCEGFRFIKPSYRWDWGGGTSTELTGQPDKYPSWVDFEGFGFIRPTGQSYAVIVYPFDRGRGTPLEAITLTDLVRQTLGVGPCQYILDTDRRIAQTPGIFTCGGTSLLKKLDEGHITQHRAEAEKLIDEMIVFVTAYRRRIQQYLDFKHGLAAYLDQQLQEHADQRALVGKMKALLEGIPSQLTQDYPGVVRQLSAEYRATLNSEDPAARKHRAELHRRYTAAGGAQDSLLAKCHQAARLLRYQAGMTLAGEPVQAAIAVEVRHRASAVLQNPMYHETKDRHRL